MAILDKILETSILVEEQPDKKGSLSIEVIQRLYGAVLFEGNIYSVKTTVKKIKEVGNNFFTYEVVETELKREDDGMNRKKGDAPQSNNPAESVLVRKLIKKIKPNKA